MFERASKKLGLDQAIFLGGAFQNKADTGDGDDNMKKLNKVEIETLLKKGIMGLIEDKDDDVNKQANKDIDEILNDARIAKYSLINGTYTFSKSSFAAKETDTNLNIDDPDFWDRVFQNTESKTKKLKEDYEVNRVKSDYYKDLENQKELMIRICDLVSKLIESKKKMEGYSADDEANLDEILTKITTNKMIHKHYKDIAIQMATEIKKPSRRAKKITLSDLEIDSNIRNKSDRNTKMNIPNINDKVENFGYEDELYESGSEGGANKDDNMS